MAAVAPNNAKVSSGQGVAVRKISPVVALINKEKLSQKSQHNFESHGDISKKEDANKPVFSLF